MKYDRARVVARSPNRPRRFHSPDELFEHVYWTTNPVSLSAIVSATPQTSNSSSIVDRFESDDVPEAVVDDGSFRQGENSFCFSWSGSFSRHKRCIRNASQQAFAFNDERTKPIVLIIIESPAMDG